VCRKCPEQTDSEVWPRSCCPGTPVFATLTAGQPSQARSQHGAFEEFSGEQQVELNARAVFASLEGQPVVEVSLCGAFRLLPLS